MAAPVAKMIHKQNRLLWDGKRLRGLQQNILSYLDHSPLRYALSHAPPVVFDSLVKQFWATAVVRPNAAGSHDLVATITPLMLANEENVAAHEAAGSTAEAHPEPHSPPVSPVREPTPERQPETEWDGHAPMVDSIGVTCSAMRLLLNNQPPADAAGRAKDPVLLTSLSEKLDRCMGRIDSLETELGTTKKIIGALGPDQQLFLLEVKKLRRVSAPYFCWVLLLLLTRKASYLIGIPAEFLVEDAQARKRFEEDQASERLVQQLQAEDLVQAVLPNVSEERAKELDDLMMRMTETDWLNLMLQVGSNPALAKELLGADVNEGTLLSA
ncbi:hypothetical protein Tco_0386442 [Tanacetum coccineum]